MRISADPKSPHYSPFAEVRLDGRPVALALEADDVEGWVDLADVSAPRVGEQFWRAGPRLRGSVEIREARDA